MRFINERPCVKVYCIALEAGYAQGMYVRRILNRLEDGDKLPDSMVQRLIPVMRKYGYRK